jgi:germination protein M
MNETDATLYVSSLDGEYLTSVPISIRRTAQISLEQVLLQGLIDFEAINGLEPPLPDGTQIQMLNMRDGICYVDLSNQFLNCAGNASEEGMAVRAVAATLCSLDNVEGVKLSVNGKSDGYRYYSLENIYVPDDSWFY